MSNDAIQSELDWTESARHTLTKDLDRSRCRDCGVSARDTWLNKQALCSSCWKDAMACMSEEEILEGVCCVCGDNEHELYGEHHNFCAECYDAPPSPSQRWDAAQEAKRGEL